MKTPKDGGPLGAGVRAELIVDLRGDLREALAPLGFADADFSGTVGGVPFGFMLGELPWIAGGTLSVGARVGRKASGALR